MYVRGGLTCHFRASCSCTSLKPDCRSSSQSAQSPIPSFHVLTFFEVKAMTPLAVPPDLNGFINMDLRPLFAWFLHKYPLKEPISFAFLELAGLGQGRGVEQPSQSRKRQACQQHLPRRPGDPQTHGRPSSALVCVSGWGMGVRGNTALAEHRKTVLGAGVPGIWPEETAGTITYPSPFVPLDVLLFCEAGKPVISAFSPATLDSF